MQCIRFVVLALFMIGQTAFAGPQSWSGFKQVAGVGSKGQGADLVITSLDDNPLPDMILMAYDNPSGQNSFRYRVGLNLDSNGQADSWSGFTQVTGVGSKGQGAGLAIHNLDDNPRPEMILMAYDNPSGQNSFRYRVGRNLNSSGIASSWSGFTEVTGVGSKGQGAAVAIGQINNNDRPEMILLAYDNPSGANNFRYRIGWDIDSNAVAQRWTRWRRIAGMGSSGQGAGMILKDLGGGNRPDLLVMAYDNPGGQNRFRYRIAYDLDLNATPVAWSPWVEVNGVGVNGQGAGVAFHNLDSDPREEMILMAYDDPSGANSFRYRIGRNWDSQPPHITMSHLPLHPDNDQQVTFTATATDADGLDRIELLVNQRLVKTCTTSPCVHVGGPFPEDYYGGFTGCANASLSQDRIPVSSLQKGTAICAQTSDGRIAAFRLRDAVGNSPGTLKLSYTTWHQTNNPAQTPGVYSRGRFQVRQSYSGDLDQGQETQTGEDFWFQAETATRRYLVPKNNARLAVMGAHEAQSDSEVNYGVNAYDVNGGRGWTGYRLFAVADYNPFIVPLWYHGSPGDKIDIVFIQDADSYQGALRTCTTASGQRYTCGGGRTQFLADVADTIENSYMADEALGANAQRFNFWYMTNTGSTGPDCNNSPPYIFYIIGAFSDSAAILHTDPFRDCSTGKVFSSEPTSYRTFTHESGHSLFGLADEYCCDGGYWQPNPWPNLYKSRENCEEDAKYQGWPPNDCQVFYRGSDNEDFWHSDRSDLMGTCAGGYPSCAPGNYNFDRACRRRVIWVMDKTQ